jgi:predicted DNA-binding transcriptional regulator YafY
VLSLGKRKLYQILPITFFTKKVLKDTDEELVIELFIHPTNDITMELLKYGANVKVLEPVSLQMKSKREFKNDTAL